MNTDQAKKQTVWADEASTGSVLGKWPRVNARSLGLTSVPVRGRFNDPTLFELDRIRWMNWRAWLECTADLSRPFTPYHAASRRNKL